MCGFSRAAGTNPTWLRFGSERSTQAISSMSYRERMVGVDILGAAVDDEPDAATEDAAVDDFVAQARALDDRGRATGEAERRLAVIDGTAANLDAHVTSPKRCVASVTSFFARCALRT